MSTQPITVSRDKSLGSKTGEYRERFFRRRDIFFLLLPGILAVLTPLGYGLQLRSFAYQHYGSVPAQIWPRPWYFLSIAALVIFLILILYRLLLARRGISLHAHGLVIHRFLLPSKSLRWTDLAGIAYGVSETRRLGMSPVSTIHTAIYPNVGKPIRLSPAITCLPELAARLKASLYPRIQPGLQSSFASGQWLFFGPLAIQCEKFRLDGKEIPWKNVERLFVQGGCLVIEMRKTAENQSLPDLPVNKIPNLELLLQIVKEGVNV